jgi:electron transport complex protein RnfB
MLLVLALAAVGIVAAAMLVSGTDRVKVRTDDLIARVDDLLPQTQCGRCHFTGCRPYAEALVAGRAAINQCPPGGDATIHALADLFGEQPLPLNPAHGSISPPQVALIDEDVCIGCAKCLPACPVDAIVGAAKRMHTVIAQECTGCELCIPPCPVDCIVLVPAHQSVGSWRFSAVVEAR